MSDSPQTSPVNDQSPVLQSALSENEQEHADLSRNRIQETGSAEQVTRAVAQPLPMITSGEQIMEVPREEEAIVITPSSRPTQVRIRPTEVTAMRTSDPSLNPPEHPVQPMVEQAHEASPAPHRQSPGSITLKDFTVCDLPTKKYLKLLSPRARIRIRIGDQMFVSPTVKIGNQSAGGISSRTHWKWDFSQPTPPNDKRVDIMIERRFLIWHTCIRHIAPTTIQSIREYRRK
ncbi:hypothetical protein V8E55_006886 [Tylopilus felleus]